MKGYTPTQIGAYYAGRGLRYAYNNRKKIYKTVKPFFGQHKYKVTGSAPARVTGSAPTKKKPMTKVEPMKIDSETLHSGTESATIKISHKGDKFPKGIGSAFKTSLGYQGFITGNAGKQIVKDLSSVCTTNMFITSSGINCTIDQANQNFFDLNPQRFITGSADYTAGQASKIDNLFVSTVTIHYNFVNNTNTETELDLYFLKCKSSGGTGSAPATAWSTGLSDTTLVGALNRNESSPTPGYGVAGTMGTIVTTALYAKPQDSQLFKKYWSIEGVKTFNMAGGATARLSAEIIIDKKFSLEQLTLQNSQGMIYVPNKTYTVLAVAKGQCVVDKTVASRQSTTAATDIGYTQVVRYNIRPFQTESKRVYTNTYSTQITADVPNISTGNINIVDGIGYTLDAIT